MTDKFDTLINYFEERVCVREISISCGTLIDYEQNNAEYARDDLRSEIDNLITQINTLKSTLEWYAEPNNYYESDPISPQEDTYTMIDGGERARHTLNEIQ